MHNIIDHLSCPYCKNTIKNNIKKYSDNSIICKDCNKQLIVKNNIPIFIENYEDFNGNPSASPSIIRERLKPRIYDFTFIMTKSYRKVFDVFLSHCKKEHSIILDMGCGFKPFSRLFAKNNNYIGTDMSLNSYADAIADNHNLPFSDNTFDSIIASETLEHASDEYQLIREIRRVAKNDGVVFLSLPFVFPEHGAPFDFQRLTKYKLQLLFKDDEIISLLESNNFISTLFILPNIFLKTASTTKLRIIFYPIFVINNFIALLNEYFWKIFLSVKNRKSPYNPYIIKILNSCPIGYSLIVRIKK